jgi:hypothetical protein
MVIAIAMATGPTSTALFARRLMPAIMNPNDLGDKASDGPKP